MVPMSMEKKREHGYDYSHGGGEKKKRGLGFSSARAA